MVPPVSARFAPNWTTLAGAVEGVLAAAGFGLPRHAVMGLTGYAFAFALVEGPNGVPDARSIHAFDRYELERRLARTGVRFERFGCHEVCDKSHRAAIEWITERTRRGVPVIAWALRFHAWGIVRAVDENTERFLVDDLLTPEVGEEMAWSEWPWETERIDLLAPAGVVAKMDVPSLVRTALNEAAALLRGTIRPGGLPSGIEALLAWAEALEGERAIDRTGNAYCLAAVQAARLDAALFLEDLANNVGRAAEPMRTAARALRTETAALSRLVSLFPYPSGSPGALASSGIRRIASAALREAAQLEREAATALATSASLL